MTIMVLVAPSTLLVRIMKCDQLIYRSMVNKSQEKTKNSLECWNMKLRWMDHVDKRPNLLLPLIECLRHKVYCRLFLFLHPSVRPSVRLLGMVNSCIIAHTLFTLNSWKWGCRLQEPTLFKTDPPQFWPPSPNTQQLQFRSLPKIELYFLSSLSFCKPPPQFFSVLCLPQCIPTHKHGPSAFPHHFNWIFSFLSLPSPFTDEWLILSRSRLFLLPITAVFYFHKYSSCWAFAGLWRWTPTDTTSATLVFGCTDGQIDG